jgi:hypothetical protein
MVEAPKQACGATAVAMKKVFACVTAWGFCILLAVRTAASTLMLAIKLLGCMAAETRAPRGAALFLQ